MLHLQTGVHLHEVELVRTVRRNDELHGAGTDVVDATGGVASGRTDPGAGLGVQQRRGRLLDDLLVAALQAALPLTEVQHAAV